MLDKQKKFVNFLLQNGGANKSQSTYAVDMCFSIYFSINMYFSIYLLHVFMTLCTIKCNQPI